MIINMIIKQKKTAIIMEKMDSNLKTYIDKYPLSIRKNNI